MKKAYGSKKHFNLFYLSSILFYIAAIITFATGNENSMGVMWLCLGSAFLCLGSAFLNKSNENNDNENSEE